MIEEFIIHYRMPHQELAQILNFNRPIPTQPFCLFVIVNVFLLLGPPWWQQTTWHSRKAVMLFLNSYFFVFILNASVCLHGISEKAKPRYKLLLNHPSIWFSRAHVLIPVTFWCSSGNKIWLWNWIMDFHLWETGPVVANKLGLDRQYVVNASTTLFCTLQLQGHEQPILHRNTYPLFFMKDVRYLNAGQPDCSFRGQTLRAKDHSLSVILVLPLVCKWRGLLPMVHTGIISHIATIWQTKKHVNFENIPVLAFLMKVHQKLQN